MVAGHFNPGLFNHKTSTPEDSNDILLQKILVLGHLQTQILPQFLTAVTFLAKMQRSCFWTANFATAKVETFWPLSEQKIIFKYYFLFA